MENKISLKKLLSTIAVVVLAAMLFIPFSSVVNEVLFGIESVFALAILIYSFIKNHKVLPVLVTIFSLLSLVVALSFTRAALTGYESEIQIPVVEFFAGVLGGNDAAVGFVIAVILLVVQIIVVTKGSSRVTEVAARFALDNMNQKLFDVDNNLSEAKLTEEEAEKQKEAICNEVDYYASLEGSSKFLNGVTKATVFVILVNLLGGFLLLWGKLGTPVVDSLMSVARITTGNMVVFLLPVLVVSFALGISATRDKK